MTSDEGGAAMEPNNPEPYTQCLVQDGEGGLYHLAMRVVNPEGWVAMETGIKLHFVHRWVYVKDLKVDWEEV